MSPSTGTRRTGAMCLGLLVALMPALAAGQSSEEANGAAPSGQDPVQAAYDALIAEAEVIDKYRKTEEIEVSPTFERPHRTLEDVSTRRAPEILERMAAAFTGNKYRDTYIRWHLLWLLKRTEPGALREGSQHLAELVRNMPSPFKAEFKKVRHEVPKELWREADRLRPKFHVDRRKRVTVQKGVPPFGGKRTVWRGKRVGPPKVFEILEGAKLERAKRAYERYQQIKPKLRIEVDEAARRYNERIRDMNFVVRRYRGELIYALLQTGDPRMLELVSTTIADRVDRDDLVAFDLLTYMYKAAFEGVLARAYSESDFRKSAEILNRAAGKSDAYKEYRVGTYTLNQTKRRQRNFADYAFHIVRLMRNPELMNLFPSTYRNQKERQQDG